MSPRCGFDLPDARIAPGAEGLCSCPKAASGFSIAAQKESRVRMRNREAMPPKKRARRLEKAIMALRSLVRESRLAASDYRTCMLIRPEPQSLFTLTSHSTLLISLSRLAQLRPA